MQSGRQQYSILPRLILGQLSPCHDVVVLRRTATTSDHVIMEPERLYRFADGSRQYLTIKENLYLPLELEKYWQFT